jgi:ABC-type glycerol-3-phosphate transport system substrate-binding protein
MSHLKNSGVTIFRMAALAVIALIVTGCGTSSSSTPATVIPSDTGSQEGSVMLTVALPSFMTSDLTSGLVSDFERTHPGVKVNLVKVDAAIPAAAASLDKHLSAVQQYSSTADVLYVASTPYLNNTSRISTEATRAGYFLNLKPLVDSDPELNSADYYPAIWQSYQWDQGVWALPFGTDPYVLTYDPAAFDSAQMAYPTDQWTLDDLSAAVRKLAIKDSSGKITRAGLDVYGGQTEFALRGLLTGSTVDSSSVTSTPQIDSPASEVLLNVWLKLDQDGLIGSDYNKAPLSIAPGSTLALATSGSAKRRAGVLLPGGQAILDVQGFAVSAGTQFPEQSYLLAEWLTKRTEIANNLVASVPARKSLQNAPQNGIAAFTLNITPEMQTLLAHAVDKAIPVANTRFSDYLVNAYTQMKTTNATAQAALQIAQNAAMKNQKAAADSKGALTFAVQTPIPTFNLPPGKIALKFAVIQPQVTNQPAWQTLIDKFTTSDSNVAAIFLDNYYDLTGAGDVLSRALLTYDCVYAPFNGVTADRLPKMLNFDPLLAADKTFDKSDILGNTLNQVTINNKIWMLPADISPYVLKYDSDHFKNDGLPLPDLTWTVDQFADALKTLKADSSGQPGFIPTNTFGTYLFQLIAAYGGNPIDYRTNPPTINFTDPATAAAIQQIVTLAKNGDFKYRSLFGQGMDLAYQPEASTIRQVTLTGYSLESLIGVASGADNNSTKLVLYPKGSKFSALTFNLGGFYISATAQDPEACYRFISQASRTPALYASMPARRSLLSDPTLVATQGGATAALYKQIGALLDDPTTLPLPGLSLGTTSLQARAQFMPQLELFEALDSAILNKGDLDAALKKAETSAQGFQTCAASLPAPDVTSVDSQRAYINGFSICAIKADPDMAPFFASIKTN